MKSARNQRVILMLHGNNQGNVMVSRADEKKWQVMSATASESTSLAVKMKKHLKTKSI
ncbi:MULTISPECIES: hypothetical protein [Dickeya]|uniref:hypothetical protein n=1 Tax=Dickeya TaxID=204037 RepID=UPI0003A62646|nr:MULTISPECIES: hypothetical protein [Dickeya]